VWQGSFADTEAAEDLTQEIIGAEFPGDLRQCHLGHSKVFRQQLTGLAVDQGALSRQQQLLGPIYRVQVSTPGAEVTLTRTLE
jgi:hypothetical protein